MTRRRRPEKNLAEEAVEVIAEGIGDGLAGLRKVTKRSSVPRAKPRSSPYFGVKPDRWADRTRELIADYPIPAPELVQVVLRSWDAIFESTLGDGFHIGVHIFPSAQIMGTLLHELIPLEVEVHHAGEFRAQRTAAEKDLVCVRDDRYSTEIKTSSHKDRIFANRSYGQQSESEGKKAKSGYYVAVNFEKWPTVDVRPTEQQIRPPVRLVRLGWIDHTDWVAQTAETGQAAALPPLVENSQLLTFYKREG